MPFFWRHRQQELGDVVRVQRRCLRRKTRRQICVSNDRHTLVIGKLAWDGDFAVTTSFGGQVDNHGSGLHSCDHLFGDQCRSRTTGNQRSGDHDVHFSALFHEQLHLCFDELLRHDLCVTASARAVLFHVHLDELGSERLDLLSCCRARIETSDDGSHSPGCGNGTESSNSSPNDEDFTRRDLASCCGLACEVSTEVVAGFQHSLVSGDIRH